MEGLGDVSLDGKTKFNMSPQQKSVNVTKILSFCFKLLERRVYLTLQVS